MDGELLQVLRSERYKPVYGLPGHDEPAVQRQEKDRRADLVQIKARIEQDQREQTAGHRTTLPWQKTAFRAAGFAPPVVQAGRIRGKQKKVPLQMGMLLRRQQLHGKRGGAVLGAATVTTVPAVIIAQDPLIEMYIPLQGKTLTPLLPVMPRAFLHGDPPAVSAVPDKNVDYPDRSI